jgi:hypothetical protein
MMLSFILLYIPCGTENTRKKKKGQQPVRSLYRATYYLPSHLSYSIQRRERDLQVLLPRSRVESRGYLLVQNYIRSGEQSPRFCSRLLTVIGDRAPKNKSIFSTLVFSLESTNRYSSMVTILLLRSPMSIRYCAIS